MRAEMSSSFASSCSSVRSSFFSECSSLRMSLKILLPSASKWTAVPVPRTNWYASATATQVEQFSLYAIAMFVGETTEASLSTRTISNAIATDAQSVQLLYATAAFVSVTTSLITWRMANATLKTVVPSLLLTAIAALSADASSARAAPTPVAHRTALTMVANRLFIGLNLSRCCGRCRGCRNRRLDGRDRRRRRDARAPGRLSRLRFRRLSLGRCRRRRRSDRRGRVRGLLARAEQRSAAERGLPCFRQPGTAARDGTELLNCPLDRPALTLLDRAIVAVRPPDVGEEGSRCRNRDDEGAAWRGVALGARPDGAENSLREKPERGDDADRRQHEDDHLEDPDRPV